MLMKLTTHEILELNRVLDSAGEIRIEIGGKEKYRFLSNEEVLLIMEALELLVSQTNTRVLSKIEINQTANDWLYEIEKRVKNALFKIEDHFNNFNEADIKAVMFDIAHQIVGTDIEMMPANRLNEISDYIQRNSL